MWPYTGNKTFLSPAGNNTVLVGNHYYLPPKLAGAPDKEYYKQVTMSVSVGLKSFPANKIAPDGRIVRQYGINTHDVTDQYFAENRAGVKSKKVSVPSRQLHNRNISQLKVVLNMPEHKRRDSLSQITGAIMKNEVVPPMRILQNDEFLNEHLKKTAKGLHNATTRLPPLRSVSFSRAKSIEHMTLLNFQQQQHRGTTVKLDQSSDDDDEEGLPFIETRFSRRRSSEHFDLANPDKGAAPANRSFSRRKSYGKRFEFQDSEYSAHSSNKYERRDSVRMLTDSIRDQFRAAVREQSIQQDRPVDSRTSGTTDTQLTVIANSGTDTIVRPISTEKPGRVKYGYQLRHEYGKNIEKNWFKNQYLKKQTKEKNADRSGDSSGYGLRLDIFYSPEPQSDDELEDSDNEDDFYIENDEASLQCGGFSTATAEIRSRRHRPSLQSIRRSISLDTHRELDEETDENSSASDIEIVLKDNQLIQRKTKHKLRKKRKRQLERYRAFLPPDVVREQQENDETLPLTDHEIRALRLNLKNKEKLERIKGKRKFLQIANAVFVVVQFRNILLKIRRRKKTIIKKRQQRIAQMVAKRLAKKMNENRDESETEHTPRPTLKDQFMQEIGQKLISDVERLNIPKEESRNEESGDEVEKYSDSDSEERRHRSIKNVKSQPCKTIPVKTSKFETELKKISLKDLRFLNNKQQKKRKKRTRKRRHSIPKLGRPLEFFVEIPEKIKRRGRSGSKASTVKQKEVRRPQSPPAPKCSCNHGRHSELASRTTPLPRKCPHQSVVRKRKMKIIKVETGGLMRTHSLDNLAKKKPIELRDLIADIDIPAKEIKLEILARKFRRQRRKREQVRLSPCRLPERPVLQQDESEDGTASGRSESSDESDYDFVYGGPFVGSGVMWNTYARDLKKRTWTDEDVNREVKRITKLFHEMKECTYLRLDEFNDAIVQKLKETSFLM